MSLRNLACQREQQRHRVLRGGDDVGLRGVGHHHAALGGGVHVDVVDPDTGATDHLEVGGPLEQAGVEPGGRANQQPVELADAPLELAAVPAVAQLDLEPGVAQELHARVADLLGDQNLHAGAATGTPASRKTRCAAATPVPSSTSWPSSRRVISSAETVTTMSKAPK